MLFAPFGGKKIYKIIFIIFNKSYIFLINVVLNIFEYL